MNYQEFAETIFSADAASATSIAIRLPSGSTLAPHFHLTEVGRSTKEFVDCGGVRREHVTCILQTYVANDTHHRLTVKTLQSILRAGETLELAGSLPVEIEVQQESVSIFEVQSARITAGCLEIQLGTKSTACLSPDKCGIETFDIELNPKTL